MLTMVAFRNAMSSEPLSNWQVEGKAVSFARGDAGHVVVNAGDENATLTLATGLPTGKYCNILADDCDTNPVNVDAGSFSVEVPARSAVVLQVAGG